MTIPLSAETLFGILVVAGLVGWAKMLLGNRSPSNRPGRVLSLKFSRRQSVQAPYVSPFAGRRPSAGSGGVKIKCPECGRLNWSDEWYCERCGAELPTLSQLPPTPRRKPGEPESESEEGWFVFGEFEGAFGVLSPYSWAVKTPADGWLFDEAADDYSGDLETVVRAWRLLSDPAKAMRLRIEAIGARARGQHTDS